MVPEEVLSVVFETKRLEIGLLEGLEAPDLVLSAGHQTRAQVVQEGQHLGGRLGHFGGELELGVRLVAQQARLLVTQFHGLAEERDVVVTLVFVPQKHRLSGLGIDGVLQGGEQVSTHG